MSKTAWILALVVAAQLGIGRARAQTDDALFEGCRAGFAHLRGRRYDDARRAIEPTLPALRSARSSRDRRFSERLAMCLYNYGRSLEPQAPERAAAAYGESLALRNDATVRAALLRVSWLGDPMNELPVPWRERALSEAERAVQASAACSPAVRTLAERSAEPATCGGVTSWSLVEVAACDAERNALHLVQCRGATCSSRALLDTYALPRRSMLARIVAFEVVPAGAECAASVRVERSYDAFEFDAGERSDIAEWTSTVRYVRLASWRGLNLVERGQSGAQPYELVVSLRDGRIRWLRRRGPVDDALAAAGSAWRPIEEHACDPPCTLGTEPRMD